MLHAKVTSDHESRAFKQWSLFAKHIEAATNSGESTMTT